MSADYDTFFSAVANAQWDKIMETKTAYSGTVTLSRNTRSVCCSNDVTSDESLAYEGYLTELAMEWASPSPSPNPPRATPPTRSTRSTLSRRRL